LIQNKLEVETLRWLGDAIFPLKTRSEEFVGQGNLQGKRKITALLAVSTGRPRESKREEKARRTRINAAI
jgi:hypothetical protein